MASCLSQFLIARIGRFRQILCDLMPDPNLSSFNWPVADLLRGDDKPSNYEKVIFPFPGLRRLDCVLGPTSEAVLAEKENRETAGLNFQPAPRLAESGEPLAK